MCGLRSSVLCKFWAEFVFCVLTSVELRDKHVYCSCDDCAGLVVNIEAAPVAQSARKTYMGMELHSRVPVRANGILGMFSVMEKWLDE